MEEAIGNDLLAFGKPIIIFGDPGQRPPRGRIPLEVHYMYEIDYSIRLYDNVGHSPAWPLTLNARAELRDKGLEAAPPTLPDPGAPVLTYERDGKTVGFLSYQYDEERNSVCVLLSYVLPEYRRQRIHTLLFNALVEHACNRGDILSIESFTHVDNKVAQASFEAQGRQPIGIHYRYSLRNYADGKDHLE